MTLIKLQVTKSQCKVAKFKEGRERWVSQSMWKSESSLVSGWRCPGDRGTSSGLSPPLSLSPSVSGSLYLSLCLPLPPSITPSLSLSLCLSLHLSPLLTSAWLLLKQVLSCDHRVSPEAPVMSSGPSRCPSCSVAWLHPGRRLSDRPGQVPPRSGARSPADENHPPVS